MHLVVMVAIANVIQPTQSVLAASVQIVLKQLS
jgi:hypothetical protein